ncbi:MAG TPA: hypothetical protein VKW06_03080 [Candidatus Angelobacter sp.]|nr:hypothetical protein [Candidatus Angelobacter sp.]
MKDRLKFVKITEQMKHWSAALGGELLQWENVTAKRMFGMTVYFREDVIFAALPLTRAFETPTSIAFKIYKKNPDTLRKLKTDPLIVRAKVENPKWIVLELREEKDLGKALQWLSVAYGECR